jgi:hypothetical protein
LNICEPFIYANYIQSILTIYQQFDQFIINDSIKDDNICELYFIF